MFSSGKIRFSAQPSENPADSPPGSLWGWGTSNGLLGDGTENSKSVIYRNPVQIGGKYSYRFGDHKWSSVSGAGGRLYAIREDGTLWAWGLGVIGDGGAPFLEDGTESNRITPVQIGGAGSKWKQVSDGGFGTLAIRDDGTMWSWGMNLYGILGDGGITDYRYQPYKIGNDTWKSVYHAGESCSAIRSDGTLWSWGRAEYVGDGGVPSNDSSYPVFFVQRNYPVQISTHNDWVKTHLRSALRSNGEWWVWGRDAIGCCDEDAWTKDCTPSNNSTSINPDPNEDLMCRCPGCVYGTVPDINGILVDNGAPRKIVGTWSDIYGYMGIRTDGTLWGYEKGHYLAQNGFTQGLSRYGFPVRVYSPLSPPETTWTKISHVGPSGSGGGYGAGIRPDGSLWTWGDNSRGQCGTGLFGNYTQDITRVGDATWSEVICCGSFTLAIR